jgi:hypothetical protein
LGFGSGASQPSGWSAVVRRGFWRFESLLPCGFDGLAMLMKVDSLTFAQRAVPRHSEAVELYDCRSLFKVKLFQGSSGWFE